MRALYPSWSQKRLRWSLLIVVTAGLILLGLFLIKSRAAGPFVSVEPESASLSGVQSVADQTASGGAAIGFGTAVLPPPPPPPPGPGADPVVFAAGDIAQSGEERVTSDLILAQPTVDAVLPLGDNAYEDATLNDFRTKYDPTWGRFLNKTYPTSGNHEYHIAGAPGYFDYFNGVGQADGRGGPRGKGYYSFDLGSWHLIALNSECSFVACAAGSAQETWLKADLAAHHNQCTLAFWHRPRFASQANDTAGSTFWTDLYNANADLILGGHHHLYERFRPQNPAGGSDPTRGIREIIAGTGGASLGGSASGAANHEVGNSSTFGVLRLTLHPTSYDWKFLPVPGKTFTDQGTTNCH